MNRKAFYYIQPGQGQQGKPQIPFFPLHNNPSKPTPQGDPIPPRAQPSVVVLDTNVALDGLVFDNPAMRPVMQQLRTGALRWLATPGMRQEFAYVLQRSVLAKYVRNGEHTLRQYDALTQMCAEISTPPAAKLRCRDQDDQRYIDLALNNCVRWLVSRDRDLLCLAGRAARLQLTIVTPEVLSAHLAEEMET